MNNHKLEFDRFFWNRDALRTMLNRDNYDDLTWPEINEIIGKYLEHIQDDLNDPILQGSHMLKFSSNDSVTECYTFEVDENMNDDTFSRFLNENYKSEIYSDYDCTGQWFTSSIIFTRIDDNVYTVLISSAQDI